MGNDVRWKAEPEHHDYAAAASYLSLTMKAAFSQSAAKRLEVGTDAEFAAKDILRASHLELLPRDNHHVKQNMEAIESGDKLSPILLIRGNHFHRIPLIVADGYHRMCAVYWYDEDAMIPCRIADLP